MKEPTTKQLDMLKALNPFRIDANDTFAEAAKELGVAEAAIKLRMQNLKQRCPEVYENFRKLRIRFNRDKRQLKDLILLDPKVIEQLEKTGKIKEIF